IDVSFPKGQALSEWLVNVGASPMPGQLAIRGAKLTVEAVLGTSQRWIYNTVPTSVQYFSFGAPVEMPTAQCGKVVFSDLHVSQGSGAATDDDSDRNLPFPTGCRTTDLSPQEKALLFMLFDLSACIIPGIG
ncbi:MAG: carboxypeptidase regulatory-like domain-containing protein, partial [Deltaproteobacteria bacterium]|nr:carboxypeptidase regulatory-like domain-containing protein [Deltaproteobacteria bacterium]